MLQGYGFLKYLRDRMSKSEFMYLFNVAIIGIAGVVFLAVIGLTYAGKTLFQSWSKHIQVSNIFNLGHFLIFNL